MNDVILQSKLIPPLSSTNTLVRQRLLNLIDDNRLLNTILAPAGYGKTTLIRQWQNHNQDKLNIQWLSLDQHDNHLEKFLTYFTSALGISDDFMQFEANSNADLNSTLINISNVLVQNYDKPVYLILDNFHAIQHKDIIATISFFLRNPIPQLRFIILSRAKLPFQLAQYRVQQQLGELKSQHLAFTTDEIADYFKGHHALDLTSAQVEIIETKTGGWIACLQILALRISSSSNIEATLEEFSGEDQYITEYFQSELLAQYSTEQRDFLIHSSILDILEADLCNAVLQRRDSAEQLIERQQQGIPLISLDTTQSQYQYHPLFADFLRSRLDTSCLPELHQRVSEWYSTQDKTSNENIEKALYHAKYVSQENVLQLLTRFSSIILRQGYNHLFLEYLDPIPYETLFDYPRLLIAYLWAMFTEGKIYKTIALLEEAENVLPNSFMGEIYALRTQLSAFENDPQRSRELAQHALDMLSSEDIVLRGLMQLSLARLSFFYEGQTLQAIKQLTNAITLFEQANHYAVWAIAVDCLIAIRQRHGSLLEAEALCRYAISTCEKINRPDFSGTFYSQLGKILYERNFLQEAEKISRHGRSLSRKYAGKNSFLASSLTLSRIVNPSEAEEILEDTRQFLQADSYQITRIAAFPISHLAEHGWIAPWIDWHKHDYDPKQDTLSIQSSYTYLDLARRLSIGNDSHPRKAITLLLDLEPLTLSMNQRSSLLEVLILLALNYKAIGDKSSATISLQRALLIATHTNHRRLFLDLGKPILELLEETIRTGKHKDYALRLLDNQVNPSSYSAQSELNTPLTSRELDILRLLSDGYSNPEMSQYFDLSVSTIRWHVKNIYRKLDVNNRTRATIRARDLGII